MFAVLAVAIFVGAVFGLATGGRVGCLARVRLRGLGLLVVGACALALVIGGVVSVHGSVAMAVRLGAYRLLAAFAAANLGRGGMGVVLTNIALNAIPIAVNSGMPVEAGT